MKIKLLLLTALLLVLPFIGQAQSLYGDDVVEIVIEKGGQLEKSLQKANALNAKKLWIHEKAAHEGVFNIKDILFLSGLSQLEELYIDAGTDLYNLDKYERKNGKIILTNANFPNLKKIGVGSSFWDGLFDLKVQGVVINDKSHLDGITFEDVYTVSKPNDVPEIEGSFTDGNNWSVLSEVMNLRLGHLRAEKDNEGSFKKIHAIHVGDMMWLISLKYRDFNPAIIYIHDGSKVQKYLANYNSVLYEEDKDLCKYDGILPWALNNCTFETLILPDGLEEIYPGFFNNTTIKKLGLNKVKKIAENAFYGSHIKEIHIPATVQDIDEKAFNKSELQTIYMDGEYAPAISTSYTNLGNQEPYNNIQFIIPKGTKGNYSIGAWKTLRVLEDGATSGYTFDITEPGTLASLLTDDVKKSVVSLKLRGVLYGEDIKLLESCPNLTSLDLSETFIAQSPQELKDKQAESDYLATVFMNMGAIAQSEYDHYRLSTADNLRVQILAKLGEMAKGQKIQSDPNCQLPKLGDTRVQELVWPLQLQKVVAGHGAIPMNIKKMTLPPDLKAFSMYPNVNLTELTLPSSVTSFKLNDSNYNYENLQSLDMSACENLEIGIEGKQPRLKTIKFPKTYTSNGINIKTSVPIEVYFQGRELPDKMYISAPVGSKIYIPRGSRAGYAGIINSWSGKNFEVIEQ